MSAKPKLIGEHIAALAEKKKQEGSSFNWNYTDRDLQPMFTYDCERCRDQGVIHYSDGTKDACPENCAASREYRQRRMARVEAVSQMPKDFRQYTDFTAWDSLRTKKRNGKPILEGKFGAILTASYMAAHFGEFFCREDVDAKLFPGDQKQGNGLMLYGAMGTGKTALASTIANVLMGRYYSVMFVYVPRWLQAIKQSFGGGPSMVEFEQAMLACDCLILDDANIPNPSDFDMKQFEVVCRERAFQRKPFVVTTNIQTRQEFVGVWGGQAWDIITEKCLIMGMGGEPLREKDDFGIVV